MDAYFGVDASAADATLSGLVGSGVAVQSPLSGEHRSRWCSQRLCDLFAIVSGWSKSFGTLAEGMCRLWERTRTNESDIPSMPLT